ncbi:MAG: ATP-binding cassette domain-containing protein [Clostridia bacterium]|nr:ATP-binding cassette domain-containing protein [Clostridia bacterium]
MLEIKNVTKKLGDKNVLDNCSLTVEKGSVLGLIGPNGAGKSTLLRCICDVYQADSGTLIHSIIYFRLFQRAAKATGYFCGNMCYNT